MKHHTCKFIAIISLIFLNFSNVFASDAQAETKKKSKLYTEKLKYEDNIYSRGKKTEMGDSVEIDAAFRYQYSEDTSARFRFETDPVDNRLNNKTSKFELLFEHSFDQIDLALDLEMKTDDGDSGGTSLGVDLDSEDTFISYRPVEEFKLTFHPFNFDGEVGEEFNTWDVTRIYYIDGQPDTINATPGSSDEIVGKTIPGLVFNWSPSFSLLKGLEVYGGFGIASYQYPTNGDFDLSTVFVADRWERKEDIGYKGGISYEMDSLFRLELKYVAHTKAEETGSLLASAGSAYAIAEAFGFVFDGEFTYSKAGKNPYHLARTTTWFEQTAPFYPIYSDYYGNTQDWVGKSDFAYSGRLGYQLNKITPYVLYRYQGKNFVYRERESAHVLRTADLKDSHGGLTRIGVGSYFYTGNFSINPEVEYMSAKNPVFGNSSDLREDRILATFSKDDYLFTLTVTYKFDGVEGFKL